MFAKKKNLEAILSSFTKVVEDLAVLQQENEKEFVKNSQKIDELKAENDALTTESAQAMKVASKLQTLLS